MALAPEAITAAFRDELGEAVVDTSTAFGQATVTITPAAWTQAAAFARTSRLDMDFFCFVSAIDWTELVEEELSADDPDADADDEADDKADDEVAATTVSEPAQDAGALADAPAEDSTEESEYRATPGEVLQVLCRVSSTGQGHAVHLKANLSNDGDPTIDTLTGVYAGADWHERELFEMFGVTVTGHPNLSKIYLPDEFEGNPLRKTYKLGARLVKPWPGLVNTEAMPDDTPVTEPKPGQP